MLAELFAVMAPVLIAAGIGYGWARSGPPYPTEFIARLLLNIGTPCLVLSTLSRTEIDRHAFGEKGLALVVAFLLVLSFVMIPLLLTWWLPALR